MIPWKNEVLCQSQLSLPGTKGPKGQVCSIQGCSGLKTLKDSKTLGTKLPSRLGSGASRQVSLTQFLPRSSPKCARRRACNRSCLNYLTNRYLTTISLIQIVLQGVDQHLPRRQPRVRWQGWGGRPVHGEPQK